MEYVGFSKEILRNVAFDRGKKQRNDYVTIKAGIARKITNIVNNKWRN